MSLKFILIIALCTLHVGTAGFSFFNFSNLKLLITFSREAYTLISQAIKNGITIRYIINELPNAWSPDRSHGQQITNKLYDISKQLNYIAMHMDQKFSIIQGKIYELPLELEIGDDKRKIADYIRNIRNCYNKISKYSNHQENYDPGELQGAIDLFLGQTGEVALRPNLEKLLDIILGSMDDYQKNFLNLYEDYMAGRSVELCGNEVSPNNYLYNLYTVVVSTEMMGLVSLCFGYELRHKLKNYTIDAELEIAKNETEDRLTGYFINFKRAIESTSLTYRSCDPSKNIRGATFFEMEYLYQNILTEEYGKNSYDSCKGDCDTISLTSYKYNDIICAKMSNCWTISNPHYCEVPFHLKRYQWIEDHDGHVYGHEDDCLGHVKGNSSYLYYGYYCDSCVCTCEGHSLQLLQKHPSSTHVISLLPSLSNNSNNMVITGVRFNVTDGIVHIQIKEGQLQEEGRLGNNSRKWKDVPDIKDQVDKARNGTSSIYVQDKDFVVVDEHHNAINLDDIVAPTGCVITGIKFALAQKNEVGAPWQRLELQIQYVPFNFTSGLLENSTSALWMSSSVIHNQTINLKHADDPEKSVFNNIPNDTPSAFIKFINSSFERDMGQTTIPFLDGVPVESSSGPISGIGLFHKADVGFGGFLSFRLHSLNFAEYMVINPDLQINMTHYYRISFHIDKSFDKNSSDKNSSDKNSSDKNPSDKNQVDKVSFCIFVVTYILLAFL